MRTLRGDGDAVAGGGESCADATIAVRKIAIKANRMVGETLSIILPRHIREEVISRLAVGKKSFIHAARFQLIVERVEARHVIRRPCGRIMFGRSGLDQERPIARLCEE